MNKYESEIKEIQMVIEEPIEVEFYELKGDGMNQFKITKVDGAEIPEDKVFLVDLKTNANLFMSAAGSYLALDFSNYHGLLEVYYCKKKKGMFNREKLEVIKSVRKPFHKDVLGTDKEAKVSLKEMMDGVR